MSNYEIMYILRANLDENQRKEVNDKLAKILTDNGGEIKKVDESMGLRELAYPIKDEKKGFYVVLEVSMGNQAISEFNRLVRINQSVLRHLIISKE